MPRPPPAAASAGVNMTWMPRSVPPHSPYVLAGTAPAPVPVNLDGAAMAYEEDVDNRGCRCCPFCFIW